MVEIDGNYLLHIDLPFWLMQGRYGVYLYEV
jgi:hypothetical protein